jgi:hypothetical protein
MSLISNEHVAGVGHICISVTPRFLASIYSRKLKINVNNKYNIKHIYYAQ